MMFGMIAIYGMKLTWFNSSYMTIKEYDEGGGNS